MKTHAIHRWLILLLLTIAAGATASGAAAEPASSPSVDADAQAAVKPLVDFAAWCAANHARSAGQKALRIAKSVVNPPDRFIPTSTALIAATDDAADSPAVAKARQAAYQSAADLLLALAAKPHAAADDAKYDRYLIQSARLSPGRVPPLEAAMGRAIRAGRTESVTDLYSVLISQDEKYAISQEADLLAKGLLPAAAKKAVVAHLADDQGLAALSYLSRLARFDALGFAANKYQPCTDALAAETFLIHTPLHAMVGYVSIPWKWNPGKVAPLIVCFASVGKEYQSICDSYHGAVGDGPFIVISAVTFSNTNAVSEAGFKAWYPKEAVRPYVSPTLNANTTSQRLAFDEPGVLALVKAVHDAANTESQVYLTGFSGGGIPCYAMLISSPGLIAAAAPACANYYLSIPPRGSSNKAPVQQFFGEKDGFNAAIGAGPGLINQGRDAAIVLGRMGYDVVDPVTVPNAGHTALAAQVVQFFNTARAANQVSH